MRNAALLLGGAKLLYSALDRLRRADATTREQWRGAIGALQQAVLETQTYTAALERRQPVDRMTERQLRDLWRTASNMFYALDGSLADRLQLKAEYWADANAWTDQEVIDAGISLAHVAQLTRQLLYEGISR